MASIRTVGPTKDFGDRRCITAMTTMGRTTMTATAHDGRHTPDIALPRAEPIDS